jgi:hypothetical protein
MNCLRDNYDLIAVAVLIATLAFAPSPDTLDRSLRLVHFEQPAAVIAHE